MTLPKSVFDQHSKYIFRNSEPEFGWNVREMALNASEHLRKHLEKQLPRDKDQSSDTVRSYRDLKYVYQ